MKTTALIVAAGAGVRMGSPSPKAFLLLEGRPLVSYSLETFQRHGRIDGIVLVAPAACLDEAARVGKPHGKLTAVVEGGARRQDSVARGLARALVSGPDDLVLVHDAARPLVDADLVDRVIEAAARTGAAVPGVQPDDTVRSLGEGPGARLAGATLDRARLVLVQTPQGFRLRLLSEAYARVSADVTDDASLVEAMGHPVELVEGSSMNLKVTRAADLAVAAALLREAGRTGTGDV